MQRYFLGIALAAVFSAEASAAAIFKCVDANGKVTFTQNQNCPENSCLDDVVRAHNPTISGSSAPVQMATPATSTYSAAPRAKSPSKGVAVVGGSTSRPRCNTGLSDRDLRTAKVRGEIVPGMSRKDVESMYGQVNRNGSARGAGGSTYWNDKYLDMTHVSYDSSGCVRSSYQSGHRN